MTYTKIQWGIIFFVFCVEAILLRFSSLSILYSKKEIIFILIFFSFLGLVYTFYHKFRPDMRIISLVQSTSILLAYCPLMLGFSYLGATANQPFVDSFLASIDSFFAIYTPSIVFWFKNNERWQTVFSFIYNTYGFQFPFIIIYFSYRREIIPLQRFLMQFMIATPMTILLSIFYPAAGPYVWYGYTPSIELANALKHLLQLRHYFVDISTIDGIITIPSFHSVMALIFIYTFRHQRRIIFIPMLILNILMIFSCLPIGEHYFADILAAIPVFLLTLGIESFIFKAVKNPK
ncbi:MAG: hypothetical protein BGO67_01255 [Alphaproteobacteria bacterium 41-28]|nr:MAG: hypothetical protein BGO67_01255 [Alphaproteobacteria bacterium 41-28]